MARLRRAVSDAPFNDPIIMWIGYCGAWLHIELILLMEFPKHQTVEVGWKLGAASAIMVASGHPGGVQDDLRVRWIG